VCLRLVAVGLPVKEAAYFVNKSKQVAVLVSAEGSSLGTSVAECVNSTNGRNIRTIEILQNGPQRAIKPSEMLISSGKYMDPNAAGIVIFTSGTTGPPKGSVMRRGYISGAASVIDSLTPNDVILHVLPIHHATGLGINFFPFLLSGACIEFRSGSFDAAWMWERWRQGGLTFFSGVPTIYMRMMRYYEQKIAKLPQEARAEYLKGANQFRAMMCGSSALPRPMQEFWTRLRGGRMILTRYGATEFGAVFKIEADDRRTPKGSVGKVVTGVDVKMSDGDEGEILVKSPSMFSK
jgi:malonyl-CoA/methylmalonyl-CoA synthetase